MYKLIQQNLEDNLSSYLTCYIDRTFDGTRWGNANSQIQNK